MPLTDTQERIARLLAGNRSPDSYLAGGAALHLSPNAKRYSNDLDFFQDSVERVAQAFADDRQLLEENGYVLEVDMAQPGYIRALVRLSDNATKVEWAHESAWRFLPTVEDERVGYVLHPIDLAINKLLALVGRNEPRDFLDVLHVHEQVLPLGALCWAGAGKDPGFTPLSLLEFLKRRGVYRPEDFARLDLAAPIDLPEMKTVWLAALAGAERFVQSHPPDEIGCLYYSKRKDRFVQPGEANQEGIVPHFGRPGGMLPQVV